MLSPASLRLLLCCGALLAQSSARAAPAGEPTADPAAAAFTQLASMLRENPVRLTPRHGVELRRSLGSRSSLQLMLREADFRASGADDAGAGGGSPVWVAELGLRWHASERAALGLGLNVGGSVRGVLLDHDEPRLGGGLTVGYGWLFGHRRLPVGLVVSPALGFGVMVDPDSALHTYPAVRLELTLLRRREGRFVAPNVKVRAAERRPEELQASAGTTP